MKKFDAMLEHFRVCVTSLCCFLQTDHTVCTCTACPVLTVLGEAHSKSVFLMVSLSRRRVRWEDVYSFGWLEKCIQCETVPHVHQPGIHSAFTEDGNDGSLHFKSSKLMGVMYKLPSPFTWLCVCVVSACIMTVASAMTSLSDALPSVKTE